MSTLLTQTIGTKAVAILTELEKAFEMASAPALLSILAGKGIQGRLLVWVGQYLQGRSAAVHFEGGKSTYMAFENVTLQGGVLSPLTFNLLLEKLVSLQESPNVQISSYADDIAIIAICPAPIISPGHGQWCPILLKRKQWSSAVPTRQPAFTSDTPRPVPWVNNFRYLGMMLAHRLSSRLYIDSVKSPLSARINVLPAIARQGGGASDRVLQRFHTCSVLSRMDYALPCLMTINLPLYNLLRIPKTLPSVSSSARLCVGLRGEGFYCNVAERVAQLSVGHLVTF